MVKRKVNCLVMVQGPRPYLVSRQKYLLGLGTHDVGSNTYQDKDKDPIYQSSQFWQSINLAFWLPSEFFFCSSVQIANGSCYLKCVNQGCGFVLKR